MTVPDIPEEIGKLTEIEKRFLLRIVPFVQIIRVQNRFSQDWCRGQVVLFAKDIIELAEQLPLRPQQAGCKPEQRFRLLRFDGDDTAIYNNIFDRYVLRPDELENISLAEFAVRYETVSSSTWADDDGDIEMRLVENQPLRDENELLLDGESAEECFLRRQGELRPLLNDVSSEEFAHAEQVIQQALAQAAALNAVHDMHTDGTRNEPPICADEHIVHDHDDYCDDLDQRAAMTDDTFFGNIGGLNVQQNNFFQKITQVIQNDLNGDQERLLIFITGGAGSGKSFLLKLLVEHIKRCYAPTVDSLLKPIFVEVASLTGVAARQILGKTLHAIFYLPIEKGNARAYTRMTGHRLEQERRKWRHIRWLIIDEISMVSYENLRMIHLRLQEFKNNDLIFGGLNVLVFGDIMQLPPVKGSWCFMQPTWCLAEINLWHQFCFCELTINMRQRNDQEFIDLLNHLRFGELTTAELELLCERRRIPLTGDFADGTVVRIYPTVRQVDEYNSKMTAANAALKRMYKIHAIDESREAATYGRKPPDNVIPSDVNNCGGLLPTILLAVESRVMLRRNIAVSDGLVNGAMGVVKGFTWPALRRDQLEDGEMPDAVLIKFDDETTGSRLKDANGLVSIPPMCATFQATRGYGDVERRMLPLILCWAVTVHKLQGTTLDRAVIDLGKKNFAKGQVYVALSRVKTLEGIALSDLEPSKLLNKPHDERALAEMKRLRNLISNER
ncbi:ATP-dependent DNA helicase pif1-like [Maniola hyperantus]|uniref:ATP-dependent DNA helicase pif1-like n=1 Tax=Aphantopus hyperantus TaxID=2795564 RepID=UPI003749B4CA